ncbi:MAG: prepilin-type N-terminal cleavage/methylation domain-containing protein [Candidatus Omnitrophota bacterium]
MRGFTLLEILITVAIFTILVLGVFQLMEAGNRFWLEGGASAELRQDIIRALMRMESELKETRSISPAPQINLAIGASSPALTFNIPQVDSATGTILNPIGAVNWSAPITYALNANNQITRTDIGTGTVTIIANHVSGLVFARLATDPSNILRINITVGKTTLTRRQLQDTQQIRIKMRN